MLRSALAILLAAAATAGAKTPPDTFVVAANMSQMITLDPAAINETFAAGFMRNVCDALIGVDPDDASKLVPGVAESWTSRPTARSTPSRSARGSSFPRATRSPPRTSPGRSSATCS
jgi:peptide/nickel transport system substrate-binding protein